MAEPITIQKLIEASMDSDSLEILVNGDENTQVTTRLGETYPSAKKAIKTMFENGSLPAMPFATKALMTASALVDGDYAMVTDDVANNGLYVKTAGTWVKSEYDPLAQAKTYADAAKSSAISTAAGDATEKTNTAKSEAIAESATDATTKANTAKTEAIAEAALDATTKANEAKSAALDYIESLKNIDLMAVYN